jgi:suppressor of G2 allele of SKP1
VEKEDSSAKAPAYPTSSKTGAKDWDKLARDLAAKKKDKGKGKEESDSGADELDYDSDEGDPVNAFFKKLYKDADEDTRRAMMKSYIESNGTALSTNWAEVGKGKVETSPPGELSLLLC